MFGKLKSKNQRKSIFKDLVSGDAMSFSKVAGSTSTVTKGDEKSRLARCRVCGWICDREREVRLKDGSFAGFGINQGAQLSAGTSVGDRVVPAAGTVQSSVDLYYDRDVAGGCPCCGTYLWDPQQKVLKFPQE